MPPYRPRSELGPFNSHVELKNGKFFGIVRDVEVEHWVGRWSFSNNMRTFKTPASKDPDERIP